MAGLSKTQQALALMGSEGIGASEAARRVGIAAGTVLSAVMRMKGKNICPCCSQVVREGFEINRSVLKDG
jgi:DNA-binding CsgD family transcriptional regulator